MSIPKNVNNFNNKLSDEGYYDFSVYKKRFVKHFKERPKYIKILNKYYDDYRKYFSDSSSNEKSESESDNIPSEKSNDDNFSNVDSKEKSNDLDDETNNLCEEFNGLCKKSESSSKESIDSSNETIVDLSEINEFIENGYCPEISFKIFNSKIENMLEYPSVKKVKEKIKKIIISSLSPDINEEKCNDLTAKLTEIFIPPGTKGAVRGNLFNKENNIIYIYYKNY